MKILVATDGSDQAMKAVKRALEAAEKGNDKIFLLAVAYYSKEDLDEMPFNIQDKLEAEARQALQKAKELFDKKDIRVETLLETDLVPANAIIRKSKEMNCDHILMGSHGRSGLERAFIGSTAAKVVAQAPCSVTVIK